MQLIEMMFGGIGGKYSGYARIEPASENGRQTGLFEAVFIRPLPAVFILRLIERFIVGRIQIADAVFQAGIHDVQILIRQSQIND